ncbi:MAG: undecaprenyl/decaprenyl-phosphate alpha-N-acetylglucosaminyl 1-phosphate transferase [Elusimicrobiota bacterium]|nr:undecaprenyl/decaprenyl-phosphate alpha-N-acetylglucosaminyl 1-phosphate transferase [Elusimicrobiota bacterium]
MSFVRFTTDFQTGTLSNLRGISLGSLMMLLLGIIDDVKIKGLNFKLKLAVQITAAAVVIFFFDIRIHFIKDYWISCLASIIWITGITNAFNIIDVMDGLSSGIAFIASLAFLLISLPTEMIYVNFCTAALAGSVLAFIPFNLSKSKKIFMGDAGSLFVGFVLANSALGTSYTSTNEIGLLAPLFILSIPIYEVALVSFFRIKKNKLPFEGSKDHYALRLIKMGFSKKQIISITYLSCSVLALCAFLLTRLESHYSLCIFIIVILLLWVATIRLSRVVVD